MEPVPTHEHILFYRPASHLIGHSVSLRDYADETWWGLIKIFQIQVFLDATLIERHPSSP
jgi:hypothetical protein